MSEPPTRMELFDALIDRREGPCFNIKYKFQGERDHVPIFAESRDAAEDIFDELSGNGARFVAAHRV